MARTWLANQRGEWYVVAQTVLTAVVLLGPIVDGEFTFGVPLVLGLVLCAAGLALVVAASVGLGENLSPLPRPRDDGTLVRSGVYSLVRHPIYSGSIVLGLGWSLTWLSLVALVGALLLVVLFDVKARREEQWLAEAFPEYAEYRARVRKLIPYVY